MSLRVRTESSRFWRPDRSQAVRHVVVKEGSDPSSSGYQPLALATELHDRKKGAKLRTWLEVLIDDL